MKEQWSITAIPFDKNDEMGITVRFSDSQVEAFEMARTISTNRKGVDVFVAKVQHKIYQVRSNHDVLVVNNL